MADQQSYQRGNINKESEISLGSSQGPDNNQSAAQQQRYDAVEVIRHSQNMEQQIVNRTQSKNNQIAIASVRNSTTLKDLRAASRSSSLFAQQRLHQPSFEKYGLKNNQVSRRESVEATEKLLLIESDIEVDGEEKQVANPSPSFKWILVSCIEEALSFALEWAPSTITLYFLTQNYSQDVVSGFGLGLVWSNCIGSGLFYGLGSGLETMASHAYGSGDIQQVGKLYQKGIVCSQILFIPICLLMIFSESILSLWNSNATFCQIASEYCLMSLPGIFVASFYYSLKAILNAQNEYRIQVYAAGVNFAMTFVYCYVFLDRLEMGARGAAIIFGLGELTCLAVLNFLLIWKKKLRETFVPWTKECFQDLKAFVSVAGTIGSIVASQWIIFEFNSVLASNLPSDEYSAYIIIANFCAMCFQFQMGYATASCTFISNEMGKKNVKNAKTYTRYAFYIILGHLAVVVLPIVLLRHLIAESFTVEQDVQDEMLSVYFVFITAFTIDSFQTIITAYMRAIAQEMYCCISYFICYGAIGLTSSYVLAYPLGYSLRGIWGGLVIAIVCYIVLQLIKVFKVDTNKMAEIISERLKGNQSETEAAEEEEGNTAK